MGGGAVFDVVEDFGDDGGCGAAAGEAAFIGVSLDHDGEGEGRTGVYKSGEPDDVGLGAAQHPLGGAGLAEDGDFFQACGFACALGMIDHAKHAAAHGFEI